MKWLFIVAVIVGFAVWAWAKIVFSAINAVMEDTHE
jgi:hypothetical protein